ncbi:hypothetical protein HID58_009411 [Brassica napus]|uniref:F-box domain-containing protein n=1 Tax=Brassica napus TaxID=3708 RepID=A0ABQ8DSF7_BRANA|nr:hypothetical protein HID58_009411 [Brassica napus]
MPKTKQFRTKEIYMARRRKPEVWLNNELDRISELPDPLICRVLYHLPTKDAVRTSVLSTRWRTLWLWVPRLGLNYRVFQKKDALVFRFRQGFKHRQSVDSNKGVDYYNSYVTPWIDAAVKRKIQHLDVRTDPDSPHIPKFCYRRFRAYFHGMPLSLYVCETLVSLKLDGVFLRDSEFIYLPSLRILHLISMMNPKEATFESLISSCPVFLWVTSEILEISLRNAINDMNLSNLEGNVCWSSIDYNTRYN